MTFNVGEMVYIRPHRAYEKETYSENYGLPWTPDMNDGEYVKLGIFRLVETSTDIVALKLVMYLHTLKNMEWSLMIQTRRNMI